MVLTLQMLLPSSNLQDTFTMRHLTFMSNIQLAFLKFFRYLTLHMQVLLLKLLRQLFNLPLLLMMHQLLHRLHQQV